MILTGGIITLTGALIIEGLTLYGTNEEALWAETNDDLSDFSEKN